MSPRKTEKNRDSDRLSLYLFGVKKLSRREAALVRNAKRKAIEEYEQRERITIYVQGKCMNDLSLAMLRNLNAARGAPPDLRFDFPQILGL